MSRCSRLTYPLLAKWTLWRSHYVAPISKLFVGHDPMLLSPNDVEALDQIAGQWAASKRGSARNVNEIIDIALQHLQRDLDSGYKDEVIEDVQFEIDYRLWCARIKLMT